MLPEPEVLMEQGLRSPALFGSLLVGDELAEVARNHQRYLLRRSRRLTVQPSDDLNQVRQDRQRQPAIQLPIVLSPAGLRFGGDVVRWLTPTAKMCRALAGRPEWTSGKIFVSPVGRPASNARRGDR